MALNKALLGAVLLAQAASVGAQTVPVMKNSRHALVIGISEYTRSGIPALPGVRFDMDSAKKMAHAMGIPDSNITYLRDAEATAERIRSEIAALDARTSPGDRVFLYYSGHGTRWLDASAGKNTCTEGLIATDGKVLTNQEMGDQLKKMAGKTDKLMVFYDACFSGGVASAPFVTRSIKSGGQSLIPKFTAVGAAEQCSTPSNFRTRSLSLVVQQQGGVPENVVHVAASRPDEVSFDNPAGGGFATAAFRDCMLGEGKDLDGSGAVTVSEIAACAQQKMDQGLANRPGIDGQHLVLAGNKAFVPASIAAQFSPPAAAEVAPVLAAQAAASSTPAAAPALPVAASAPAKPVAAASAPQPPVATAPAAPVKPASPAQLLEEIHQQRDGARSLTLSSPARMKIDRDSLALSLVSPQDGYLYIALAGSDGKSLYLLYPNALEADNRVRAGEKLKLPRPGWDIVAGGPAGQDTLLVMVTDSPRELSALKGEGAGPFTKALLDAQGKAQLQWLLTNSASAGARECASPERLRNLQVVRRCSDSFASALIRVEEY